MPFREDYPKLSNFLGSWFPDADLEEMSDEEVARKFKSISNAVERDAVLEEGERLLRQTALPLEEVEDEANRSFEDEDDARRWLSSVLSIIAGEHSP